jgi:hypothetical protein
MRHLPAFFVLWLCFAPGSGTWALAQTPPLPSRPASLVYDDARLFNDLQRQEMEQLLARTQADLGVTVVIATFTYISGATINERANQLAGQWLGAEPGMIFAFNRGANQPAISVSPGFWQRYPADEITLLVLQTGQAFGSGPPVPEDRMRDGVKFAVAGLQTMESHRLGRLKLFNREDQTMAVIIAAALVMAGMGALLVSHRLRRRRQMNEKVFYFPDFEVGMRLGAPFGGGTAAETGPTTSGSGSGASSAPRAPQS